MELQDFWARHIYREASKALNQPAKIAMDSEDLEIA